MQSVKTEKVETNDALIAQLNDRVCTLLWLFVTVITVSLCYRDKRSRNLNIKTQYVLIFLTHKSDLIYVIVIYLFHLQITNLEKLIEVQNTVFNTAIEDLKAKLSQESEKRQALQSELEKLAHCVTQV